MLENGRTNRLETESIGKLMLELCTQTTFSIMLYNVYTITDTLYVSNGVGKTASGAIGIFAPILTLINGLSSTLGVGGSSIISRKLGEKDISSGSKVVGSLIWIWLVCGICITITGLLFLDPLLILLGCTKEIYPYAIRYGRIMLLSTIASTGFSGIMRAEGDITYSTLQWSCPVLINIILDPVFIYYFKMGISGAALATLLAQIFSMISSIYYFFFRKKTPCRISVKDISWNPQICGQIFSIGVPSFLHSLGSSFAGMLGNRVLALLGGTQAVSTFTMISRIQSFVSTPYSGIMQGIQPMLGFDWGRKRLDRVKKTILYAICFSMIYGSVCAVILYFGSETIMGMFASDTETLSMGIKAMRIICWSLITGGIILIVQAYFQALGNGNKVLLLSLGSIFMIRTPFLMLGKVIGNVAAVWWSFILSDWLIAGWALCIYMANRKERKHGKYNKKQTK